MALVALFLLWQTISYWGIMSLVGEWQFNAFGRHYPTFNYVFLVFILCLPGYFVFLRPSRVTATDRPEAAVFRSARAFMVAVFATAIGLVLAAIVILFAMLLLPGNTGPMQRIDLAKPAVTLPRDGPTQVSGLVLYERTAGFDEDLILTRQTYRFAPVVGSRGAANELQIFVQLPPVDEATRGGLVSITGILKRDGLPGEIVRLFRYAGFQVDRPHYVLFVDPAAMRWPYIMALVQFAVGAVLALCVGLFQRRRVRRIDTVVHQRPEDARTAAT
ncbi:hypothetical protein [uncultured Sphingomonas sp.]|uniref:hypothetical protein n=1 Tax=uncultured Sphingomonas sp. TaxID=158754 RepID=UPI0035CB70AF